MNLLNSLLTKEQRDSGITIEVYGERVRLLHNSETIDYFDIDVTVETLWQAAWSHLDWHKSGIEYRQKDPIVAH